MCGHGFLEPFGHLSLLFLRLSNLQNVLEAMYFTLHQPSPNKRIPSLSDISFPTLASISALLRYH